MNIRKIFLLCVLLGTILITLGWYLVPAVSLLSITGAYFILAIYILAGYYGFSRIQPELFKWVGLFGLLAGAIFASEIVLEYVLLPKDNTGWGVIEYGSVLFLYLFCGLFVSYLHNSVKNGTISSIASAMLGSIIWLLFVLSVFYIFRGSVRQELVFKAEGNFEDFAISGMTDFNAFIMEDFLGAAFFHLLLFPIFAAILGTVGSLIGKGLSHLRKQR